MSNHLDDFKGLLEHIYGEPTPGDHAKERSQSAVKHSHSTTQTGFGPSLVKSSHKDAAVAHDQAAEAHIRARQQTGHDHVVSGYHNLMIQHHQSLSAFHKENS